MVLEGLQLKRTDKSGTKEKGVAMRCSTQQNYHLKRQHIKIKNKQNNFKDQIMFLISHD